MTTSPGGAGQAGLRADAPPTGEVCMGALVRSRDPTRTAASARRYPWEVLFALAAFAVLCIAWLSCAPRLVEPDDYAYRASIVGITEGHLLTLSTAQVGALAGKLPGPGGPGGPGGLGGLGAGGTGGGVVQWVQLSDGRWISEKDPGYPFLAAP